MGRGKSGVCRDNVRVKYWVIKKKEKNRPRHTTCKGTPSRASLLKDEQAAGRFLHMDAFSIWMLSPYGRAISVYHVM